MTRPDSPTALKRHEIQAAKAFPKTNPSMKHIRLDSRLLIRFLAVCLFSAASLLALADGLSSTAINIHIR